MAERLAPWVWVGAGALAAVAGIVNVVGFLGFQHQAITHLTGNTSLLGAALVAGDARATARLLGSIPITPGGLGVVELGLTTALVGFGGNQVEVVAAVLVYRFLTIVPTLGIGLLAGVTWKRYRPEELPVETPTPTPPPGATL